MRRPILAVAAAALLVPLTPALGAAASLTVADTGLFGSVLEEPAGKFGTDCASGFDPRPRCKPAAVGISQLSDGRQLYWSGLEGMDEVEFSVAAEFGHTALNSGARLLDVRGGAPKWKASRPFNSGINADGNEDNEYLPLVPVNNDKVDNDGDLFCADVNLLADGRIITNGGTSYYGEPGLPGTRYGLVELQGLRNTRIFDPRTDRWGEAGTMNFARWYPAMVTQPDGSIITFSGVGKMIKPYYPNRPADSAANERHLERFDPATGKWTVTAAQERGRSYHPTAMLLPDGRVLVGGHTPVAFGYGRANDMGEQTVDSSRQYADPSFQIFSPPYLFWGKRPVVTDVNPSVRSNKTLTVEVDRPNEISSIRMMRNPTVTHLIDGDQRNVELEITSRDEKSVTVKVPDNNYLPPGPYLLFAHTKSDKGEIPSVSRQVFVDALLPAAQVKALRAAAPPR